MASFCVALPVAAHARLGTRSFKGASDRSAPASSSGRDAVRCGSMGRTVCRSEVHHCRGVYRAKLSVGCDVGRASSRARRTLQRRESHGEATAPSPDDDDDDDDDEGAGAGAGALDSAEEKEVVETTPRGSPCWADKWLKVPKEGFCEVPWNGGTVFGVMFLWFASFLLVGHVCLPAAVSWLGFNCRELSTRGVAMYSLSADVVEMCVGLGVLFQSLRPYFPLPKRWFPVRLNGGWWKEVLLGCTVFPAVSALNTLNSRLMPLPVTALPVPPWEQSLLANDAVSIGFYVAVVSFVAPVWEETIFRGFLLPSFTRYFRMDVSILSSSLIFALAHFSMERLIPLTFLGVLMCVVYLRSKNILAPIILHSLWNAFAFVELVANPAAVITWVTALFGLGI